MIQVFFCLRISQGVSRECLRSLDLYMSTAERNEETTLVAFGHRYLGEYYLNEVSGTVYVADNKLLRQISDGKCVSIF